MVDRDDYVHSDIRLDTYEQRNNGPSGFDTYEQRNNGPSVNRAVAPTNMQKVVEGNDALLALRKFKCII